MALRCLPQTNPKELSFFPSHFSASYQHCLLICWHHFFIVLASSSKYLLRVYSGGSSLQWVPFHNLQTVLSISTTSWIPNGGFYPCTSPLTSCLKLWLGSGWKSMRRGSPEVPTESFCFLSLWLHVRPHLQHWPPHPLPHVAMDTYSAAQC